MTGLLETLSHAVDGHPALAVGAAFAWGLLSILLSPCHLASLPLIVGYVGGQADRRPGYVLRVSAAFALGNLAVLLLAGAVTVAIGRIAGDVGMIGNRILAGLMLLIGLHLLGVIPLPWQGLGAAGGSRRGVAGALLLGLVFGLAVGPCTFAFLAPILGVVFAASGAGAAFGTLLFAAYAIGHCGLMVAAGAATGWVQRWLDWSGEGRGVRILRGICGVLVILAGLSMIS